MAARIYFFRSGCFKSKKSYFEAHFFYTPRNWIVDQLYLWETWFRIISTRWWLSCMKLWLLEYYCSYLIWRGLQCWFCWKVEPCTGVLIKRKCVLSTLSCKCSYLVKDLNEFLGLIWSSKSSSSNIIYSESLLSNIECTSWRVWLYFLVNTLIIPMKFFYQIFDTSSLVWARNTFSYFDFLA